MEHTAPIDQVNHWCQDLPAANRSYPFGEQAAVFKVGGKMFALVSENGPPDTVTLKGLPAENEAIRSQHDFARPGYYMNKRHWITIDFGPETPMDLIEELVQESYRLVATALPRKKQVEIGIAD
jgi:predicted DNA-binding protein (MmcQ/YjbR family)